MDGKSLGKIEKVRFGIGGYQDAMIGIHFTFSYDGCGVSDSVSEWDPNMIKVSSGTQWTEEDRDARLAKIMRYISKLLKDAKVSDVADLRGVPVEIEILGNTLKSWRILTEVI